MSDQDYAHYEQQWKVYEKQIGAKWYKIQKLKDFLLGKTMYVLLFAIEMESHV